MLKIWGALSILLASSLSVQAAPKKVVTTTYTLTVHRQPTVTAQGATKTTTTYDSTVTVYEVVPTYVATATVTVPIARRDLEARAPDVSTYTVVTTKYVYDALPTVTVAGPVRTRTVKDIRLLTVPYPVPETTTTTVYSRATSSSRPASSSSTRPSSSSSSSSRPVSSSSRSSSSSSRPASSSSSSRSSSRPVSSSSSSSSRPVSSSSSSRPVSSSSSSSSRPVSSSSSSRSSSSAPAASSSAAAGPQIATKPPFAYPEIDNPATFQNHILSLHNSFRAKFGNPALTWSPSLAKFGQEWVNTCRYYHSIEFFGDNVPWYAENIAYASAPQPQYLQGVDASTPVQGWGPEEFKLYSYSPRTPRSDGATGHFQNLVWKTYDLMGCAVAYCPNGLTGANGNKVVNSPALSWICDFDVSNDANYNDDVNVNIPRNISRVF